MLEELDTKVITETETSTISLSTAASDAVKNILAERNLEGYALRVYVAGGGCCGVNFGMALDNNIRDVDTTFEANGVKVVVDEVSIDYLRVYNPPAIWAKARKTIFFNLREDLPTYVRYARITTF